MDWRKVERAQGLRVWLVATALLIGPSMASAATYIGASYGWANGHNSDFEDSTANGWRAFLGANASGVFGWEVGYGEVSEFKGRTLGNVKVSGGDLSLLGGLPLGPVTLFGRLGAVYADMKTDNRSKNDWTYRYGVGADVGLGKTIALRFEWNRTPVKSDFTENTDVDTASAGIYFKF